MKLLPFLLILLCMPANAEKSFSDWFTTGRMRVDYILAGNKTEANLFLSEVRFEPSWGGSETNLIDTMNYGNYFFRVLDAESETPIYSRGFNTLFGEWQTTSEAETGNKAFNQSLIFPFPRNMIILEIYRRLNASDSVLMYRSVIKPDDILIRGYETPIYKTKDVMISGPAKNCVDILFIAEGYTNSEMRKFLKDVDIFSDALFKSEPFKSNKDKFNIRAVLSPSQESGTDIPGDSIWKNTVVNSSFYTFGSERYLTTADYTSLMDAASHSPFDQLVVLVNIDKYGGGGIYNFYSVFSADSQESIEVFVHEFGHGFGGLGDEYYTSSVAYSEFYPVDEEPIDPNLTTLVDFDSKWKYMIEEGTPIPTPAIPKYKNVVGVFEGGGYSGKGIYRPEMDCKMKSNEAKGFCRVCKRVLQEMINFYTD